MAPEFPITPETFGQLRAEGFGREHAAAIVQLAQAAATTALAQDAWLALGEGDEDVPAAVEAQAFSDHERAQGVSEGLYRMLSCWVTEGTLNELLTRANRLAADLQAQTREAAA